MSVWTQKETSYVFHCWKEFVRKSRTYKMLMVRYACESTTRQKKFCFHSWKKAMRTRKGTIALTRTRSARTTVETRCSRSTSLRMRERIVPVGWTWKNDRD